MAIGQTNIIQNGSGTGATSYATASWNPVANRLYLASFVSRTGITTDPTQPTATGNGLTWVVVDSVVYDNSSSSRRRVTTFRGLGAAPSAGALTFDEAGQAQTAADWIIDEFTGIDTSGTNGSGAIAQEKTAFDATGAATTLTLALASNPSASNLVYGACGYGNPPNAATAGSGFTVLGDFQEGTAACRVTTEYQANTTSPSVPISYAAGGEIGIVGIEIAAAPVTGSLSRLALLGVG